MNLDKIKVVKIDISEWLIAAIYSAKENESENRFLLNEFNDIIEFNLTHPDFDFFIDFDIYEDPGISVDFKNFSHVSESIEDVDFDDSKLDKIYSAVLSHL